MMALCLPTHTLSRTHGKRVSDACTQAVSVIAAEKRTLVGRIERQAHMLRTLESERDALVGSLAEQVSQRRSCLSLQRACGFSVEFCHSHRFTSYHDVFCFSFFCCFPGSFSRISLSIHTIVETQLRGRHAHHANNGRGRDFGL